MSNRLADLLTDLATCLCRQQKEDNGNDLCFCGVLPGDAVVADYVGEGCESENGMAWVRLTTAYPAAGVGVVSEAVGNCGKELGVDIEVGILRAFPMPEDDGSPPSAEEMLAASLQQTSDIFTLNKAITCCGSLNPKDFILSSYTPLGPLGGVYGGSFTIMLVV